MMTQICPQCGKNMTQLTNYNYCPICARWHVPAQTSDTSKTNVMVDNTTQKPVSFESLKSLEDNPLWTLEAIREHTGMIRYYALRNDANGLEKEARIIDQYAQEAYQAVAMLVPLLYEISEHMPEHVTDNDPAQELINRWESFVENLKKNKSK